MYVLVFASQGFCSLLNIHLYNLAVQQRNFAIFQTCPGLNANEMHVLYDRHHEVSSVIKVHQNTPNSVKHEVRIKQYLRSILDISAIFGTSGIVSAQLFIGHNQ